MRRGAPSRQPRSHSQGAGRTPSQDGRKPLSIRDTALSLGPLGTRAGRRLARGFSAAAGAKLCFSFFVLWCTYVCVCPPCGDVPQILRSGKQDLGCTLSHAVLVNPRLSSVYAEPSRAGMT